MRSPRNLLACRLSLALLPAVALVGQASQDDLVKKVAAYTLTLPKIEAFGAMMGDLADWAAKHRKEAKALGARAPKGLEGTAAFLKREPVLQAQLKAHQLTEEDYMLLPMATLQAGIAVLGEAQGRTSPADRINPANIALVKANQARVDAVMAKVRADQARMAGYGLR